MSRGTSWVVLAVWILAFPCLAQQPNYDALSDRYGNVETEQQHAALIALVQNPAQLEAVYADAAAGNPRATTIWREMELQVARAGAGAAEKATRPGCLVMGYRELSKTCIPNWSFLDVLSKDKPGAVRLREIIFRAFAARARERGLENRLILSAANGLVAVGVAAAVLREAELAANAQVPKAPPDVVPQQAPPPRAPKTTPEKSQAPPAGPVASETFAQRVPATGVTKPSVLDPDLRNLVRDLYKGAETAKPIGTGSTADAIRHEIRTGQPVGGKFHAEKGRQYARALEKWIKGNPSAFAGDRAAAQAMLDDLRSALAGK